MKQDEAFLVHIYLAAEAISPVGDLEWERYLHPWTKATIGRSGLVWNIGAAWFKMVYHCSMPANEEVVRQSISLPQDLAKKVRSLAAAQRKSANRVLVDLVEAGLAARDEERRHFMDVAEQLARAQSPAEQQRLKEELARMTFGD